MDSGIIPDTRTYQHLTCSEFGGKSNFQALVYAKYKKTEIEEVGKINPFDVLMILFEKYTDISLAMYNGWDAKIMHAFAKGKVIGGCTFEDINSGQKGKIEICTHKYDETGIFVYQNKNGNAEITFHDISLKDDVINEIDKAIENARSSGGMRVRRIKPE